MKNWKKKNYSKWHVRKSKKPYSTTDVNVYRKMNWSLQNTHETIKCNDSVLTNANAWSLSPTKLIIIARMKLTERAMRTEREKRCAKSHQTTNKHDLRMLLCKMHGISLYISQVFGKGTSFGAAQNACKTAYRWNQQQQQRKITEVIVVSMFVVSCVHGVIKRKWNNIAMAAQQLNN